MQQPAHVCLLLHVPCVREDERGQPGIHADNTCWRWIEPAPFSGAKHTNCLTRGAWEENQKPGSYGGGRQNKKHWEHIACYNLPPNLGSGGWILSLTLSGKNGCGATVPICKWQQVENVTSSQRGSVPASVPECSAGSQPAAPAVCRWRVLVLLEQADTQLSPMHKPEGSDSPSRWLSRQWLALCGSGASLQPCETAFLFSTLLCTVNSLGETRAKPLVSRRWDRSAAGHQMRDPSTLGQRRLKIHPGVSCCPQSRGRCSLRMAASSLPCSPGMEEWVEALSRHSTSSSCPVYGQHQHSLLYASSFACTVLQ